MMSLTDSSHMILLMIVICLLIFGMFIDGGIVVLLTTPIFLPLIKQIGVDPVMFGLLLCTVSCMGILTPPVGVAMYIVCDNLKVSLGEWMKAVSYTHLDVYKRQHKHRHVFLDDQKV